jgi:hypothetical protein
MVALVVYFRRVRTFQLQYWVFSVNFLWLYLRDWKSQKNEVRFLWVSVYFWPHEDFCQEYDIKRRIYWNSLHIENHTCLELDWSEEPKVEESSIWWPKVGTIQGSKVGFWNTLKHTLKTCSTAKTPSQWHIVFLSNCFIKSKVFEWRLIQWEPSHAMIWDMPMAMAWHLGQKSFHLETKLVQ